MSVSGLNARAILVVVRSHLQPYTHTRHTTTHDMMPELFVRTHTRLTRRASPPAPLPTIYWVHYRTSPGRRRRCSDTHTHTHNTIQPHAQRRSGWHVCISGAQSIRISCWSLCAWCGLDASNLEVIRMALALGKSTCKFCAHTHPGHKTHAQDKAKSSAVCLHAERRRCRRRRRLKWIFRFELVT